MKFQQEKRPYNVSEKSTNLDAQDGVQIVPLAKLFLKAIIVNEKKFV